MPVMYIHPAPRPHPVLVRHIEKYLERKGAACARGVMTKAAPWHEWPLNVRRAVEAQERAEAENEPGTRERVEVPRA